ncbi:MAG: tetratricopeptide repeat protein [Rhodospirillaceae bacterium]|nr:tetratricopeptide repeat protein [Rhodospirillaceae bacterium]
MSAAQNIAGLLGKAVGHHQRGELTEAEALYRQILTQDQNNGDALNLLALVVHGRGQTDDALRLIERAVTVAPRFASAHYNKGLMLETAGRADAAIASYRQAVKLQRDYADAWVNLGALLFDRKNFTDAIAAFRDMTAACPNDARGHFNLGRVLAETGDTAAAERHVQKAIALQPQYADAYLTLGNIYAATERTELAVATVRKALGFDPNNAGLLTSLGTWLAQAGDTADAIRYHEKACALNPTSGQYYANYSAALVSAGRAAEGLRAAERAIALEPHLRDAHFNYALALSDVGRHEEAIAALEYTLVLSPDFALAYQGLAMAFASLGWMNAALIAQGKAKTIAPNDAMVRFSEAILNLAKGNLRDGWKEFESRFDLWATGRYRHKGVPRRAVPPPYWAGEDVKDKTILVWSEQGVGDETLYGSMLDDLAARGANVIFECSPRMAPVFARSLPGITVRSAGSSAHDGADFQIALGSLGQYLRPDVASFPKRASYLKADPARVSELKARYGAGPLIGISWVSKAERIGAQKSAALLDWAPLLRLPGARFVNLQYGDSAAEIAEVKSKLGVEIISDPTVDPLKDMDAFFAQVAAMDAVVTVSNTTAHVAGALGVPAWVLLSRGGGSLLWYWFLERADSPWYASMRLVRGENAKPGWAREPLERIATDATAWLKGRGHG